MRDTPVDSGQTQPPAMTEEHCLVPRSTHHDPSDLVGVDPNHRVLKLRPMVPYLFLAGIMLNSPALMLGALAVSICAGLMARATGHSRALAPHQTDGGRELLSPAGAVRKGFGAVGFACLSIYALYMVGFPPYLVYPPSLFRGIWAFWTWRAVRSASRTDAQSGWMAGATSLTAFSMFWWAKFGFYLGIVAPICQVAIPTLGVAAAWQTWRFLSTRGVERSRAALKASVLGAAAALLFAPIGAPSFLPTVGLAAAVSLFLPAWMSRHRLQIGQESQPPALPEACDPATPR
jgi:hypothetical protein